MLYIHNRFSENVTMVEGMKSEDNLWIRTKPFVSINEELFICLLHTTNGLNSYMPQ